MAKLSCVVPARNEKYLSRTVQDLLEHATGDVEIIPVLDGYVPTPPLPNDPRVKVVVHATPHGMRKSINDGVATATGDFLLKCDAHCAFGQGYDEILTAECDQDWVVVPTRYELEPETWTRRDEKGAVSACYLTYPYMDRVPGLHARPWWQRAHDRRDIMIDDEMSSQGSVWMMPRAQWNRIGPLDSTHLGPFSSEFQEIGLKTWLGGGRVLINKRTFYSHWRKREGQGYALSTRQTKAGIAYCTDFWMHDRWPERVHDMRWLIEKFAPVPTWPEDLDATFRL